MLSGSGLGWDRGIRVVWPPNVPLAAGEVIVDSVITLLDPARKGAIFTVKKKTIAMKKTKNVALVAHDNKKQDLLEWIKYNKGRLTDHNLFSTGTTGRLVEEETGISVQRLQSGPLGGDQQMGSKISRGEIDFILFFWDPLEPHPHDPDVKALLRIAVVWNIPIACNRSTADFMFSSHLMSEQYEREIPDYDDYKNRDVPVEE